VFTSPCTLMALAITGASAISHPERIPVSALLLESDPTVSACGYSVAREAGGSGP
jgi:hypothetical protein